MLFDLFEDRTLIPSSFGSSLGDLWRVSSLDLPSNVENLKTAGTSGGLRINLSRHDGVCEVILEGKNGLCCLFDCCSKVDKSLESGEAAKQEDN